MKRKFSPAGSPMHISRLSLKRILRAAIAAFVIASAVAAVSFSPASRSAQQQSANYLELFDKTEVMIPVRDGVKIHTEYYVPKNVTQPLPILLERTPYGISAVDKGASNMLNRYAEMIKDGYIFAFQDIRGRYG